MQVLLWASWEATVQVGWVFDVAALAAHMFQALLTCCTAPTHAGYTSSRCFLSTLTGIVFNTRCSPPHNPPTGKSTLFKMIMGVEKPDGGQLEVGDTVVPMYVDQSRDALDPDKTVSRVLFF